MYLMEVVLGVVGKPVQGLPNTGEKTAQLQR
jgi:hypothetical protein